MLFITTMYFLYNFHFVWSQMYYLIPTLMIMQGVISIWFTITTRNKKMIKEENKN